MKKILCMIMVLVSLLGSVAHADMAYIEYANSTKEIRGVFGQFIELLNDKYDEQGELTGTEVALWYEYTNVYFGLDKVSALQTDVAMYEESPKLGKTASDTDNLYLDMIEIAYEKYCNGESTQSEFFEAVRPIVDIVLTYYQ